MKEKLRKQTMPGFFMTLFFVAALACAAADQPQWGEAWSRNMVSGERGLPDSFDPATGKNIKWTAKLGDQSYASPIVAGGRVYLGTNNQSPRDEKHKGDRGVLFCLDERDGKLLWQLVVPKRYEDPFFDWPKTGICSPPTIEGDRVYVVNNRGEVMCLDALGMANGNDGPFKDEGAHMTPEKNETLKPTEGAEINPEPLKPPADGKLLEAGPTDADVLWITDLVFGVGIWPHDAAHSSVLIHGDYLYLNTGTGVDNTHKKVRRLDAPSIVVINKKTGKLVARDDERIAPNIFHNTWSSPSLGKVDGKELIFFAGGNGIVYAFEPVTGDPPSNEPLKLKKVFQYDFDPAGPKEKVHVYNRNTQEGPSNIYGMPVFYDGSLWVAGGGDIFWGKNFSWLKRVDPRGSGNLGDKNVLWSCPLGKHTMTTPAIADGLVYATDSDANVHCIDAKTGSPVWQHKMNAQFWASPLVADGKVYVGTRRGQFSVLAAGREKKVLSTVELGAPISGTATAANGVVYVATMTNLYAIAVQDR